MTINDAKADLKEDLQKSLTHLKTLRDEVRVKLHLAGMDAKAEWNKLEPHLTDLERAAGEASEATVNGIKEAVKKVKKFGESL
jgi:hypothetical protein